MLQNSIVIKQRHQKFIHEVIENKIVWTLKSKEGYVSSESNKFYDQNDEPLAIICFWSNMKLANVCRKKYWKEYDLTSIEISKFLENWCVGMHNDNTIVGTNFDWKLFGHESDPLELILELLNEIQQKNVIVNVRKYKSIEEFKEKVKEVINQFEKD